MWSSGGRRVRFSKVHPSARQPSRRLKRSHAAFPLYFPKSVHRLGAGGERLKLRQPPAIILARHTLPAQRSRQVLILAQTISPAIPRASSSVRAYCLRRTSAMAFLSGMKLPRYLPKEVK